MSNPTLQSVKLIKLAKEMGGPHPSTGNTLSDVVVTELFQTAEKIAQKAVVRESAKDELTVKLDNILTSKLFGYPIMLALLAFIFWLTIVGANIPSMILSILLFSFQDFLTNWFFSWNSPAWLHGVLVLGLYRTMAWVVSVMLPPMAIFFPLFTILEDLGYLPRVAFNLDHLFKKANACGKQSLTMCMGFGCNAVAVTSCRIIDSPRERMIAILTNNFVPCNGRFPGLIAIGTIFSGGMLVQGYPSFRVASIISGLILLGIGTTFLTSMLLSRTFLKGESSSMVLELPSYRKPHFTSILYRSVIDRTLFVLRRALAVAAPAGAITWVLNNYSINDLSLAATIARFFDPFATYLGLDGTILLAFILGFPANEIVLPILMMNYLSSGYMIEFQSLADLGKVLMDHGWTWLTAVNFMLFSLLHWPCGTTLFTTLRETKSKKWTFLAFLLPTSIAITICFTFTQVVRFIGIH